MHGCSFKGSRFCDKFPQSHTVQISIAVVEGDEGKLLGSVAGVDCDVLMHGIIFCAAASVEEVHAGGSVECAAGSVLRLNRVNLSGEYYIFGRGLYKGKFYF